MALEHFCKGFAASLPAEKVASLLGNVENKVRPAAANGCDLCLTSSLFCGFVEVFRVFV